MTHFGDRSVPITDKVDYVSDVFHSVAHRYDLMNDLMSWGMHRIWKRLLIHFSFIQAGQTVLDLAGGTGDVTRLLAQRVGIKGRVILADINTSMLQIGRDRSLDEGYTQIQYVQADAESLPFENQSFDAVTMAFGLRNVTDKSAVLSSIWHVLQPGAPLLVLEFSKPVLSTLKSCYHGYLFNFIPKLGEMVTGDRNSYQYLAESIRLHPDQETLLDMMRSSGFEYCRYYNLLGGIVAIHKGYRL